MKRKRKLILIAALLVAVPCFADLPVFDLTSFLQLVKQVAQGVQTYTSIHNQENMWAYSLTYVTQAAKIAASVSAVLFSQVTVSDTWGETSNWPKALTNGGGTAVPAWTQTSVPLTNIASIQGTPQQQTVANIELRDSFGQSALDAIGTCQAQDAPNQTALANLLAMVQDGSDAGNSPSTLQNNNNLAAGQQLSLEQCNQDLQRESLKLQLAQLQQERNAQATLVNMYAAMNTALATQPVLDGSDYVAFQQMQLH